MKDPYLSEEELKDMTLEERLENSIFVEYPRTGPTEVYRPDGIDATKEQLLEYFETMQEIALSQMDLIDGDEDRRQYHNFKEVDDAAHAKLGWRPKELPVSAWGLPENKDYPLSDFLDVLYYGYIEAPYAVYVGIKAIYDSISRL